MYNSDSFTNKKPWKVQNQCHSPSQGGWQANTDAWRIEKEEE